MTRAVTGLRWESALPSSLFPDHPASECPVHSRHLMSAPLVARRGRKTQGGRGTGLELEAGGHPLRWLGGELTTGLTFPLGRQDLGGDDSSRPSLIFLWEETFDGRWRQRLIALHWELTQLL